MKNKIKKIHVESLMKILADLYDEGVDYVDIEGESEGNRDTIRLSFSEDYMDPDFIEGFDNLGDILPALEKNQNQDISIKKLTDDDIRKLL